MASDPVGWRRLVHGSAGRKTRCHTMRGELVPLRAGADLPWLIARRLAHRPPDGPWLNAPALRFLKRIIRPDWTVFEFGSGRSTVWYARRVASVLALESDANLHMQVSRRLALCDGAHVELVPAEGFPDRARREPDDAFDLVVVDGAEQDEFGVDLPPERDRTACVAAAKTKVRPGGILLFDNSDVPRYGRIDDILAGWHRVRFSGFSSYPLTPWETSFYWRPAGLSAD